MIYVLLLLFFLSVLVNVILVWFIRRVMIKQERSVIEFEEVLDAIREYYIYIDELFKKVLPSDDLKVKELINKTEYISNFLETVVNMNSFIEKSNEDEGEELEEKE
ncbi:hypothetical protein M0R19_04425 [Candidatus Pacearchaeota archaeon]|nr:hypothetical protein [Candidatus Pacearchaeota archaeon]